MCVSYKKTKEKYRDKILLQQINVQIQNPTVHGGVFYPIFVSWGPLS